MSSDEIDGEWQYVTSLYENTVDDSWAMTLAEAIAWLQGLAEGQPCPPGEIVFKITQSGDQWDGYGLAEIKVYRAETDDERQQREAAWADADRRREEQREAEQRRVYEALKAKYETPRGAAG